MTTSKIKPKAIQASGANNRTNRTKAATTANGASQRRPKIAKPRSERPRLRKPARAASQSPVFQTVT